MVGPIIGRETNHCQIDGNSWTVHPLFLHTLQTAPDIRTLEEIPQDVLQLIASRLMTPQELCVLQCVSRRCREAAGADNLWKRLCMSRFAVPESCSPPSWQQLYRFNYEFLYKVLLARSQQLAVGFPRYGTGTRFVGMDIAINV